MQPLEKFKAVSQEMQNVTAKSVPAKHVIAAAPATAVRATVEVVVIAKITSEQLNFKREKPLQRVAFSILFYCANIL